MNRNSYVSKCISVFLIVLLISTPIIVIAQDQEDNFAQGKVHGERDAKGNGLWFLAGAGCGIFGVGAAYISKPAPPAQALVGKSAEYVIGYTQGYQNKARNTNMGYACGGWAAFVLVYAAAGGFSTSD